MNSNALSRLGTEYDSDSSIECQEIDSNVNQIKSEDEFTQAVSLALNRIIENVCNDFNITQDKHSHQLCFNSKNFSRNRLLRSEEEIDISSDSSKSSWSLSSSEQSADEELVTTKTPNNDNKVRPFVKTKGEISIDDLPPIENLSICLNVEELTQIGRVVSIIDTLIITQSFRSMPALDLESVLFLKDGTSLGSIFDVFGPVIEPRYVVRFNTNQQIIDRNISVDTPVYFAAEHKSDLVEKPVIITKYVFTEQLRRMKGSDASWKHNNEPPEEVQEFSDDETERIHKQRHKSKRRHHRSNNYGLNQSPNIRVPPNTPNTPFNRSHSNHYQRFSYQMSQQNNWFANA